MALKELYAYFSPETTLPFNPFCYTPMDLTTHELGRGHLPVRVHLIQILQIVSFQDVGQDIGSFPNVNHPVRLIGEIFGAKLNVARVRCTVHTACWAEGGVVVERVGNHEGVANSQGEGKARRVGRREDGQENDQRLQEATNRG